MSWLALAVWGGVVGLDATSFPQVMVSRPFVAATVAGAIVGRPGAGAIVGALLEVFAVAYLPIGAARNPEPGTAAVAATAALAAMPAAGGAGPLVLALAFGLVWEHVGGASVHVLRRLNESVAPEPSRRSELGPAEVEARHLAAMALDFIRGAAVTVAGAWIGAAALGRLGPGWPVDPSVTAVALTVAAGIVLGAALSVFDGWRRHRVAFGLGLLGGMAMLLA